MFVLGEMEGGENLSARQSRENEKESTNVAIIRFVLEVFLSRKTGCSFQYDYWRKRQILGITSRPTLLLS